MPAFERIYSDHYRQLFRIALKLIPDANMVQDILQEVFLSLYTSLNDGKKVQHPFNYLLRSTLNKCIDANKRNKRFEKINGHDLPDQVAYSGREGEPDTEALNLAMKVLKPGEKQIIVLYSEGYSYREIAEISDTHFNSVGKTISRALQKMKVELKKIDHEMSER